MQQVVSELDMDWIHPWFGLDWIGLDWVQFLVEKMDWIGIGLDQKSSLTNF